MRPLLRKCVCGHSRREHVRANFDRCLACTCPKFVADQRGLVVAVQPPLPGFDSEPRIHVRSEQGIDIVSANELSHLPACVTSVTHGPSNPCDTHHSAKEGD